MTISTTTTYNEAVGTGAVLAFPFTFVAQDASTVKVYLDDVLQGSGYTVSLNSNQTSSPGGTVTFTSAPALDVVVYIERDSPKTQPLALAPYGVFSASAIEEALDRKVLEIQEIDRDRAALAAQTAAEVVALEAARVAGDAATMTLLAENEANLRRDLASTPGAILDAWSVLATGTPASRSLASRFADTFNVKDFGAHSLDEPGYSTFDSSAAFQACFDAAVAKAEAALAPYPGGYEVVIPPGAYRLDSGVILQPDTLFRTSISIRGLGGEAGVNIFYFGVGGTALSVYAQGGSRLENFRIWNSGSGDTTGIAIGNIPGVAGTAGSGYLVQSVGADGFKTGMRLGLAGDAALSEVTLRQVSVDGADVGILITGINTLNVWLYELRGVNRGPAVRVERDNVQGVTPLINLAVVNAGGGHSSGYTGGGPLYDFVTPGYYSLINCVAEFSASNPAYLVRCGTDLATDTNITPMQLLMQNCREDQPDPAVRNKLYHGGRYIIVGGSLTPFELSGAGAHQRGTLEIIGANINNATPAYYKSGSTMIWDCHYRSVGRSSVNNQAVQADEHFVFVDDVAAGTKRVLSRFPWDTDYGDGGADTQAGLRSAVPEFPSGVKLGGVVIHDQTAIAATDGGISGAALNQTASSWLVTATGAGAVSFTIEPPFPYIAGQRLRFILVNNAAGAFTPAWNVTAYKYSTAAGAALAAGKRRVVEFECIDQSTGLSVECFCSADV